MVVFATRTEVIEFCLLPIAALLPSLDCQTALHDLFKQLLELCTLQEGTGQRVVSISVMAECLQLSEALIHQLADIVASFLPYDIVFPQPGGPTLVSVHAITLFLLTQLYGRQAQRHDTVQGDHWPSPSSSPQSSPGEVLSEPHSPASPSRRRSHTDSTRHTSKAQRVILEKHSRGQGVLVDNFQDFVRRNVRKILLLVRDEHPPASASGSALEKITISRVEFDRFALMIRAAKGDLKVNAASATADDPMDVDEAEGEAPLSSHVPLFDQHNGSVPLLLLAQFLQANFLPEATRTRSSTPSECEVKSVHKSSILRGGLKDGSVRDCMRIRSCHESVVYLLAPVQHCLISACTDCTVVVGAVGGCIRMEHCERVQLIVTCSRVLIASCHDCILYLGTNKEPLVLGDNRFVQVAPYNTCYQGLRQHMKAAGVSPDVNLWDQPIELASEEWQVATGRHAAVHQDPLTRDTVQPVTALPPTKLLPFLIPFTGGEWAGNGAASPPSPQPHDAGRGGAASSSASGRHEAGKEANPFTMPKAYDVAMAAQVKSVSDLRSLVKSVELEEAKKRELQAVIQGHFKDWLVSSGNMRQVYDLARIERDHSGGSSQQ